MSRTLSTGHNDTARYSRLFFEGVFKDLENASKSLVAATRERDVASRSSHGLDTQLVQLISELVCDPDWVSHIPPQYHDLLENAWANQDPNSIRHSQSISARLAQILFSDILLAGYLLYSSHFRTCCEMATAIVFDDVWTNLHQRRGTVIAFCQVRWLSQENLQRDNKIGTQFLDARQGPQSPPLYASFPQMARKLPVHPHSVVLVPQPNGNVGLRKLDISIISEVRYNKNIFAAGGKPLNWPEEWKWPQDPQSLRGRERARCRDCGTQDGCDCTAASRVVLHPLLDIYEYSGKGAGARALQSIKEEEILEEYVGEVLPATENSTGYGMDVDCSLVYHAGAKKNDVALIDSVYWGNWTRFINHSCEPNCEFQRVILGGKVRIMVVSIKPISMFDEIVVSYGDSYFDLTEPVLLCRCGTLSCKYSSVEKIKQSIAPEPEEPPARVIGRSMGRTRR
ncbi:MAG: hypothetical protein MMC23_007633 [Stictis urceolatum]|nr:hypothetical protein [Stictis urceolata]